MELKNAQSDKLLSDVAQGATTATLVGGNFGTPATPIYLVFDHDVAAKYEVKLCTVAGASITNMSHISGANIAHAANCNIGRMMNVEVIDDVTDGTSIEDNAIINRHLADNAVETLQIKDANIITAKIADANITAEKLATTAITLGYAQITNDFNTATIGSDVDVTGLSVTVAVPVGGRRVKVTGYAPQIHFSGAGGVNYPFIIKDGTTTLSYASYLTVSSGFGEPGFVMASFIPTAGNHTYKLAVNMTAGSGTTTVQCGESGPAFILVELI